VRLSPLAGVADIKDMATSLDVHPLVLSRRIAPAFPEAPSLEGMERPEFALLLRPRVRYGMAKPQRALADVSSTLSSWDSVRLRRWC
jgi:hypothetical protein